MPNYYTDRYNYFIKNAEPIFEYLSGNYMNALEGKVLDCGESRNSVGEIQIFRIMQFRKMENDQVMAEKLKKSVEGYLSSLHRYNCAACLFIISSGNDVKLYFASGVANIDDFRLVLKGCVPDLHISNENNFISELNRISNFGGVVTGIFNCKRNYIDDLLDYMTHNEAIIGLLAKPVSRKESLQYSNAIADLLNSASAFDNINNSFGNASKINVARQFPGVNVLKDYLNKQYKRFGNNTADIWESCLWFGSSDKIFARELGGKIAGLLTASDDDCIEKGKYFLTINNPLKNKQLAISNACYDNIEYDIPQEVIKGSLKSWVTTSELSSMFQLPVRSHQGINVITTNKTLNETSLFDTIVPDTMGKAFEIGKECTTNQSYMLAIDDFAKHALVTGGTGSGKTNTVKTMLHNFYRFHIPFCVIEPSKKEYWHMVNSISNLRIYSSGFDAINLKLNPLEPEDGVIMGNHIDELMYALSGAFEMEEPTRLTLIGLIKYTYIKFGWKLDEIAYKQSKQYPSLSDVLNNLYEYSKIAIRSGNEVTANIEGSVSRRLESLTTGTAGNILNTQNGISGKEMCEGSVLVELDDLSLDTKPFITNILLIKISQHLRQRDSAMHKLKNVIVLEEAHNIIPEPSKNGIKTSSDLASEFFSNILSQIREFGTGVIVADQGASQINSHTIANTAIKIVHALTSEQDANAEEFALRLNTIQKERLPELKTGEALIAVRGENNVCKVKINKNNVSDVNNYSCMFCKHRQFCDINDVISKIQKQGRGELLLAKVYSERFNILKLKRNVNSYFDSINLSDNMRNCAFGYMIANGNMPCGEREKRRILYRYVE